MNTSRLFLITGVSSGFGRAIATEAIRQGHTVVGTVRDEAGCQAFEAQHAERAHARRFDVTQVDGAAALVAEVERGIGAIDVLINNAGYGHEGVLEESPLDAMRRQFEVNVFGAVALARAVMPGMRTRRRGHIVNITSMGGYLTMPGIGYYCGSKFALEGLSGVMAQEMKPFGVAVTAVAPGSFRTDWAGRSMVRSTRTIADYDALFDPVREARQQKHGRQLGDPAKAAAAILELVGLQDPPAQLLLGSDALELVRRRLQDLQAGIAAHEALSRSTDFAEPAAP
ncbi:oxidoreductase [Xylophilus sp. GOD-11R]|uniref:oxidoreductase n=1 Tax=Xylophilus sp. GOD-11R TaxID=3089814 RepID=UPI00298C3D2A|nr:oxidoreductase [Xylophilus sp. GOD-11R]WPB58404.1 oxidoreductase [Xylophilus sp. GOD-11R]